ncbi:DUF3566 domain-containing protein [Mumia sp. zg.B53]|nr:DUF3566 domain-containing protein [Mumia sp. zg.B53]
MQPQRPPLAGRRPQPAPAQQAPAQPSPTQQAPTATSRPEPRPQQSAPQGGPTVTGPTTQPSAPKPTPDGATRPTTPSPSAKQAATKAPVPTAGSIAESETTTVEAPTARQTAVSGVPASTDAAGKQRRPKPYEESPREPKKAPTGPTRKARLRVHRVDPWSVMKMSFALAIALGIVTVVAVTLVWAVLGAAGVWDAINSSVATVLNDNADAFDIGEYVGFGRIIGLTILIAAIDVVLITALATVGAFLYNLAAQLLGGFEVTLAEDD